MAALTRLLPITINNTQEQAYRPGSFASLAPADSRGWQENHEVGYGVQTASCYIDGTILPYTITFSVSYRSCAWSCLESHTRVGHDSRRTTGRWRPEACGCPNAEIGDYTDPGAELFMKNCAIKSCCTREHRTAAALLLWQWPLHTWRVGHEAVRYHQALEARAPHLLFKK